MFSISTFSFSLLLFLSLTTEHGFVTMSLKHSTLFLTILIFLHYFHQVAQVQIDLVFRCLDKVCDHSVGFQYDGTRNL